MTKGRNWLQEQAEAIAREIEEWPEWMRRVAGLDPGEPSKQAAVAKDRGSKAREKRAREVAKDSNKKRAVHTKAGVGSQSSKGGGRRVKKG